MTRQVARPVVALLLAAFLLRLAAGFWWQSRQAGPFYFGDSDSYWQLGRCLAHGQPYSLGVDAARVFRTPGYPALLAPIFLVAGDDASPLWGRGLSAALETLSVAGVGWLAGSLFGGRAGLMAMAAAALYPESAFGPWLLVQLGLWIAAWKAPSAARAGAAAFAAGVAAAAATLVRPSWLLFTPFAIGVGLAFAPARGRHLALGMCAMLGLMAAMTPWWCRNHRVTGHVVLTSLQAGAGLYDGLHPAADGGSNMDFAAPIAADEKRRIAEQGDAPEHLEYRLDRRMRDEAVAWAKANPRRAAQLAATKFFRLWNVWPNEASLSSWPARLAIAGAYVPILALGLAGAWRTRRLGWPAVLCWLPAVYLTMLHMVFVSSLRYRHPAMLGLIVLAAAAASGWNARSGGNRPGENPARVSA
jgi:hypothetical protein